MREREIIIFLEGFHHLERKKNHDLPENGWFRPKAFVSYIFSHH